VQRHPPRGRNRAGLECQACGGCVLRNADVPGSRRGRGCQREGHIGMRRVDCKEVHRVGVSTVDGACEVARANCVLLVHQAVERGEGQPVQRAAVASAPGVSPQGRLAPQPGRGSPPSKPAGGCTVPATARRLYFRDPLRPVRSSLARQPVRRERGLLAGSVCPSGTPTRRYLLRCQRRWLPSCSSPATHVGGYFR